MKSTILKIFFLVSVIALPALAFAAWRDAPAGPPNYGAVSPDTQDDYKPMNLGSADQTKTGGVSLATDAVAKVGIGDIPGNAKLAVSNPNVTGDAVAAYSNSANSAVYAEQAGSGYAIYASGGMSYFGGNVGIGTASPAALLDLGAGENGGYTQKLLLLNTGNARSGWGHVSYEDRLFFPSDGHMSFGTIALTDGATWAEKMRVENDGRVGIGTTGPQIPLHVIGSINAPSSSGTPNGSLMIGGNGTGVQMAMGITADASPQYGWIQPRYTNNSNNYNLVLNPNGGNIGIGTPGPGYKLDVQGGQVNASGGLCMAGDCKTNWAQVVSDGGGVSGSGTTNTIPKWGSSSSLTNSIITQNLPNNIDVAGSVTASGLIDSGNTNYYINPADSPSAILAGSVGIGTTSPGAKLDVYGASAAIRITGPSMDDMQIIGGVDPARVGPTTNTNMALWANGGEVMRLKNGNVGIGTTDPAGYRLNVNGTVNATTLLQGGTSVCLSTGANCPASTTYSAGSGLSLSGTTFSLNTANPNTWTAAQTFSGGANFPGGAWDTSGNVGIGAAPGTGYKLNAVGSSGMSGLRGASDTGSGVTGTVTTGIGVYGIAGSSGIAIFGNNSGGIAGYFNGNVTLTGVYQYNSLFTESSYQFSVQRYVADASPSMVGTVMKLDTYLIDKFCKDRDGCQVTIAMLNWDSNNIVANRSSRFFMSELSDWWRSDWYGNDPQGYDNYGPFSDVNAWDCYFTDGETSTNNNNGRTDSALGFGLLNVRGGSYSDTSTTCRIIIED